MNREAYKLANEIKAGLAEDDIRQEKRMGGFQAGKYKRTVLEKIRETENPHKRQGKGRRFVAAAACAGVLLVTGIGFGGEAHALIEHISWGIGSALGLSGTLSEYRDVVGTTVADKGYAVTLQEVVAAEEKLVVNYTLQREDGKPMEQICSPFGSLWMNGEEVMGGSSGSGEFLNEEKTIVGIVMSYDMFGVDMSEENTYQLKFHEIGADKAVKGRWDFQFTARGTDLIAATKKVCLGKEFAIGDDVTVVLEELTINDLEQRISYSAQGDSSYMMMLMAEDDTGKKAEFDTRAYQGSTGKGYMQNQEILYDGRISENAQTVKLTLYAVEMPKESGKLRDDYRQVGEPFEVELK